MSEKNLKPVNKQMLKVTILVVMFVQMATNGLSPAMSEISAAFPDASASTVQLLMSLPGIFVVVLSFVSAGLTKRFSKKFLIGLGLVFIILVAICGTLFHGSLQILFVWSCLMGLGMGLLIALTASLIADYFTGREAENMMGLQTSAGNIGGMIMTAVGGVLTAVSWNLDYCVYFLAVPGLLLLLFFVPGRKTEQAVLQAKETPPAEKGSGNAIMKNPKVWMYVIFCALAAALVYAGSNIGTFLTPQITNIAQAVTGSDSTYYRFLLAVILAAVVVVVTLILMLRERRLQKAAQA